MPSSLKAEEETSRTHPPEAAMVKITAKNSASSKNSHRRVIPEQDVSQRRTSRSTHIATRGASQHNLNSQSIPSTEQMCSASSRPRRVAKTRQLRSKMVPCPLCNCEFLAGEIERHASLCLEANISHVSKPSSGSRKKKRSITSLSASVPQPRSSNQLSPSSHNTTRASSGTADIMSETLPVQSSKRKVKTQVLADDIKVDTKHKKTAKKTLPSDGIMGAENVGKCCFDVRDVQPLPKKKKVFRKSEQNDEKSIILSTATSPPSEILKAASQKIQAKFPLGLQKKNGNPEWITSTEDKSSISPLLKTLKPFPSVSEAKQFIEELHKCTTPSVFFEFLALLKCARSGNLSVYQLMRQVKTFLGNKKDLLDRFNIFLPGWYKMENIVSSHEQYFVNEGSARTDKMVLWSRVSGSGKTSVFVKDITNQSDDRKISEKKVLALEKKCVLPEPPLQNAPSGNAKLFPQYSFPTETKHSPTLSKIQALPQYASVAGRVQYSKVTCNDKPDTYHTNSRVESLPYPQFKVAAATTQSPRKTSHGDLNKSWPKSQVESRHFLKITPEFIPKQQQHTGVHGHLEAPKYDFTQQKHVMPSSVSQPHIPSHGINNNSSRSSAYSRATIQAQQKYQNYVAYGSNALNKEKPSSNVSHSNIHHKAPPNGGPTHSSVFQQHNQFSKNASTVKVRSSNGSVPLESDSHRQTSYLASDLKVAHKGMYIRRSELQTGTLPVDTYRGNSQPNVIKTLVPADERMSSISASTPKKSHPNYIDDMRKSGTHAYLEANRSATKGAMYPPNNPVNNTFSVQPVPATKPANSVVKPPPQARPASSWNPILVHLPNAEDSKPFNGMTKPEKAKNAFTYFCRLMKPNLHKKFSHLTSDELKKKIQEETQLQWRKLSDAHKLEFVNRSVAGHERYEQELKVWKEVQGRRLQEGKVTKEELGWN